MRRALLLVPLTVLALLAGVLPLAAAPAAAQPTGGCFPAGGEQAYIAERIREMPA